MLQATGDHSYDRYLPFTDELHKKDLVVEAINILDRRGRLMNLVMGKIGARMVDVVENNEGELELENTFALKKLEALQA